MQARQRALEQRRRARRPAAVPPHTRSPLYRKLRDKQWREHVQWAREFATVSPHARSRLYREFRAGRLQLSGCNYLADFGVTRATSGFAEQAASASETVQLFAFLRYNRLPLSPDAVLVPEVVIKVGRDSPRTEHRGATTVYASGHMLEEGIYRRVVAPLVALGVTPNLIPYVATLRCGTPEPLQNARMPGVAREAARKLAPSPILGIVTERGHGTSLSRTAGTRQAADAWALLAQGAYTLLCMEEIGLLHADLHAGNAFVERLHQPVELVYEYRHGKALRVRTQYVLKLFDWDRSYKAATDIDGRELRQQADTDAAFFRGLDWLWLASYIGKKTDAAAVTEWVRGLFDERHYRTGKRFAGAVWPNDVESGAMASLEFVMATLPVVAGCVERVNTPTGAGGPPVFRRPSLMRAPTYAEALRTQFGDGP